MTYTIIIFCCFIVLLAYASALLYAVEGWQRQRIEKCEHEINQNDVLTIVMPIHNATHIPQLPQDVRVVIVDDHSNKPIHCQQSNVEIIPNTYQQGKKWALRCGIEHATTPYIATIDCDIVLPEQWLSAISCYLQNNQPDMLILPLRMESKCLFGALQETEYVALQMLTGGYALRNNAIMCAGANLIFKRDKWLLSWDDIQPDIPSGDDMFMLHSFKQKGYKIEFLKSKEATAHIMPCETISQLFRQRSRWAGKAGAYTDKTTKLVGATMITANLAVLVCPPLLLVKWLIDMYLLWYGQYFFELKHLFLKSLLLSFVYPFYILITLMIAPFRKNKW